MANNDNTPLGNILGFVGFISGCVFGWNATQSVIVALVAGFILACVGVFMGNMVWKVVIILLSIAISVGTCQLRREVTSAVVSGIKGETEEKQDSVQPGQSSASYVTGIGNTTNTTITFRYRWGESGKWTSEKLKPGYQGWYANESKSKFYIAFDHSFKEGEQIKNYYLHTKLTTRKPSFEGAQKYKFYLSGEGIDLVGSP